MKLIALAIEELNKSKLEYHNLSHTGMVYSNLFRLVERPSLAQIYGVWFHDVVYKPGRQDNEEKSIEFFQRYYEKDNFLLEMVSKIILATKLENHLSNNIFDNYVSEVMDCDLSGIATEDFDEFLQRQRNIILESTSSPEEIHLVTKKQKELLNKFIDKDYIFRTPKAIMLWEKQARININRYFSIV
jgi:predicted metal-dependent HD superfamily phosphohydrolase